MGRRRRRARRARGRWREVRLPASVWGLLGLMAFAVVNYAYQVIRKPTEIYGLVVSAAPKSPAETWAEYGALFRAHSTDLVRPELLAALAQVESAGDPLARTYWRWRWSLNPFEIYAPASSAVGLLQLTDGTFEEARRFCIHDHQVVRDGPWHDPGTCWFNALYFRTVPSHAIEMTSARLHQVVVDTLAARRVPRAAPGDAQALAAVIHLCGRERGGAFAARAFRALPGERCGDHDLRAYLARVRDLAEVFARLDAGGAPAR